MTGHGPEGINLHIKISRGWELPERDVTPEPLMLARRSLMAGAVGMVALGMPAVARAQGAPRNAKYDGGRELTAERDATTYNNYYEFGTDKSSPVRHNACRSRRGPSSSMAWSARRGRLTSTTY